MITSYFIALKLNPNILKDIFYDIGNYLKTNSLDKKLILQNIDSIHITLYYLQKDLSNIKDIIYLLENIKIRGNIFVKSFSYFYRDKQEFILYLEPKTNLDLRKYRNYFERLYSTFGTEDNNLEFIPHISFIKILDYKLFKKHKENLENIILVGLNKIKNLNISEDKIYLYSADSSKNPEKQDIMKII